MELKLSFKETVTRKVNLDLDKVAKILIEQNIDSMLDDFTCNIEDYLSNICTSTEVENILECEENISKLEGKLKSCLLSICKYENTSSQKD